MYVEKRVFSPTPQDFEEWKKYMASRLTQEYQGNCFSGDTWLILHRIFAKLGIAKEAVCS